MSISDEPSFVGNDRRRGLLPSIDRTILLMAGGLKEAWLKSRTLVGDTGSEGGVGILCLLELRTGKLGGQGEVGVSSRRQSPLSHLEAALDLRTLLPGLVQLVVDAESSVVV